MSARPLDLAYMLDSVESLLYPLGSGPDDQWDAPGICEALAELLAVFRLDRGEWLTLDPYAGTPRPPAVCDCGASLDAYGTCTDQGRDWCETCGTCAAWAGEVCVGCGRVWGVSQ